MAPTPSAALAAYTPDVAAVGDSLTATALLGLVPLAAFFVLLMAARRPALHSALGALLAALLVAVLGYGMPLQLGILSATQGLAFGLFPVMLIVVSAIWFYELTVKPATASRICAAPSTPSAAAICASRPCSSRSASADSSKPSPVSAPRSRSPPPC